MGWETRRNGLYYYRKRRIGGQVVSEYVGSGPLAQLLEMENVEGREDRERQKVERDKQLELDRVLSGAESQLRALVESTLRAAGFHNPKRQWRKKRGNKTAEEH